MVDKRQISQFFPGDNCEILFHTMNSISLKFDTIIKLTIITMKSLGPDDHSQIGLKWSLIHRLTLRGQSSNLPGTIVPWRDIFDIW